METSPTTTTNDLPRKEQTIGARANFGQAAPLPLGESLDAWEAADMEKRNHPTIIPDGNGKCRWDKQQST
ncbi:hypothetical protein TNCV_1709701 [Trichonephila clavipes]|nr:hypothetical protein TNCV_1709701 [Trichonephila clavipes]